MTAEEVQTSDGNEGKVFQRVVRMSVDIGKQARSGRSRHTKIRRHVEALCGVGPSQPRRKDRIGRAVSRFLRGLSLKILRF